MQSFEIFYSAPIPVGHRVEMVWYRTCRQGLLSGTKWESHQFEPVIRDVDTGIVHGPADAFWAAGTNPTVLNPESPLALQLDVHQNTQIEYSLSGTVIACRIATYGSRSDAVVQTTLVVEPG